jgi:hypothetical protein
MYYSATLFKRREQSGFIERVLPFTHGEKGFKGDRYGDL